MIMNYCPKCGSELKENVKFCAKCGERVYQSEPEEVCINEDVPISDNDMEVENQDSTLLPDMPSDNVPSKETPQKVEVTGINITISKPKKRTLIIIIICVLVAIIAGIVSYYTYQQKKIKDYEGNLSAATSTMLLGATTAEKAGGLIHDVWYNTIYKKSDTKTDKYTKTTGTWGTFHSDFNDSLQTLFADSEFNKQTDSIEGNQLLVKDLMKKLQNPPKQYEDAYEKIKDFYDVYLEFTNLVINPPGNLQSYTNKFNELDSDTVNAYQAMDLYIK